MTEAPHVEVSYSTLSASPTNKKRPWQIIAAGKETAKRITALVYEAETVFDVGNVSASLHLGRNTRTKPLARRLRAKGVPISDIDVPAVKKLSVAMVQAVGNGLTGNFKRAENHIGWAMTNVGSGWAQRRKVKEGLNATKDNDVQVIRTQALDLNSKKGKKMVHMLAEYAGKTKKPVVMAIEINADKQTAEEYVAYVLDKYKEYQSKGIHVFMDIDLGHIARSGTNPLTFLKLMMKNPEYAKLVRFVTFNQYIPGEKETHALPDAEGGIDFQEAAKILGDAYRAGKIVQPTILFETHPRDYAWHLETPGQAFAGKIKNSYTRSGMVA